MNEAIDKARHADVAERRKRLAHGRTIRKQDWKKSFESAATH